MASRFDRHPGALGTSAVPSLEAAGAPAPRARRRSLAALLFVALAVGAVYVRALDAPFFFDDHDSILENPSIRRLWPLFGDRRSPGPLDTLRPSPVSGRPLVNLSLAVNYRIGELAPRGYRILNLAVHVASALLLAALVRRGLQRDLRASAADRSVWGPSVVVALLWALHPLQTEAVAYVTQRTELFVGFFYLATLYASLRSWSATSRAGRRAWTALAALACIAGAASKEVIASAPLVVLLFERQLVSGSLRAALRRSWPLYAALASSWLVLLALNAHGPRSATAGFDLEGGPWGWWMTEARVLWLYLRLVVWPWPLAIHYATPPPPALADAWPWVAATALLAAGTVWLLVRRHPFGFLAAAAWLVLSPTLVVPIGTEVAAERRMHLPLAALATMAVLGALALGRRWQASRAPPRSAPRGTRAVLACATALVLLACGLVGAQRLGAYASELSIWRDALAREPDDPIVHQGLGSALVEQGRWEEAAHHFASAVALDPAFADAYSNLAGVLRKLGRREEALAALACSAEATPGIAAAQLAYGSALAEAGRLREALARFDAAVRLRPGDATAHFARGTALLRLGRAADAAEALERCVALDPERVEALNNLGLALFGNGAIEQATARFERAVALDPRSGDAHFNLARALLRAERTERAIAHLEQALALARDGRDAALARNASATLRRVDPERAPLAGGEEPASLRGR